MEENGEDVTKKFKYKLPFDWHFRYRHAVDNQKNLRHTFSSIKDTWVTDWWECRLFAFILATSEVNTFLILRYFVYCGLRREGMPTPLEFRRKLAWQLINNIYIGKREGGGGEFLPDSIHWLRTVPRHTGRYQHWRWICTAKNAYQQ